MADVKLVFDFTQSPNYDKDTWESPDPEDLVYEQFGIGREAKYLNGYKISRLKEGSERYFHRTVRITGEASGEVIVKEEYVHRIDDFLSEFSGDFYDVHIELVFGGYEASARKTRSNNMAKNRIKKAFENIPFPESFKVDTYTGYSVNFWKSGSRHGDTQQYCADNFDMSRCGWSGISIYLDITIERVDSEDDDCTTYECSYIENYYNNETEKEEEWTDGQCILYYHSNGFSDIGWICSLDDGVNAVKSPRKSLHKYWGRSGYCGDMRCLDCGRIISLDEKDRIMEHTGHMSCPDCGRHDFVSASRRKSSRKKIGKSFDSMVKAQRNNRRKIQ